MKYYVKFLIIVAFCIINFHHLTAQNIENIGEVEPLKITGSLGATMMFYHVEGREAYRKPFTWMLNGSPTLSVYGITLPFSFTISEQQRNFRQPFNKFGVSPYYKWAKLNLGYRNITFSPYTLAGHTILGAGTELNPGKFRFGFMYGQLLKAVSPDDQINDLSQSYIITPTYQRKAWSMKAGFGTASNYADVILLKGWDNENSLNLDSTYKKLTPSENFIVSFNTYQRFAKHFHFKLEVANSLYTDDIRVTSSDSVNHGLMNAFGAFYTKNSTTSTSTAIESALGYGGKVFSLNLKFKRIDPGYRSMGAYYFQNDLQNIVIEPSLRLANNKYNFTGSMGFQRDNLNDAKPSTTKRKIGSFSFTGTPVQPYNFSFTYSNYDLGQSAGTNPIDSLYEISQTTQNIAVNQNLNLTGKNITQSFVLAWNYQKLTDNNSNTSEFNAYNSNTVFGNYALSFIQAQLTFGLGYSYTSFVLTSYETKVKGPNFSVAKSFFSNKLSLSVSDSYNRSSVLDKLNDTTTENKLNRITLQTMFMPAKKHRFSFRFYINKSTAVTSGAPSYSESKGDISYVYTF